MNEPFNLLYVLRVLLKWKWMIIGTVVVAGIVAILVSVFVLPEMYLSSAKFYPVNQGITDRSMLFSEGNSMNYVEYYGTKQDLNRTVELANSSPIIDFVINYFHMAQHYGYDTSESYWRTRVKKKFLKNYTAIKTENEAVEISLLDENPDTAARIINTVLEKIDELNKQPVIKNKLRITETFRKKVAEKQIEVDSLAADLVRVANRYAIKTVQVSDESYNISGLNNEGIEVYKLIRERHDNALKELGAIQKVFEQYEVSSRENVPSITILEKAWPADRRTKPVRSLVCITTVLIAGFIACIGALLIEEIKKIKQQLNDAG